ncbi:HB2D protein, partial [Chloroceryle aenea]|nr:HB2D protein [Chloroceryle aenea]
SPDRSPAHTGVFQEMGKAECQFLNGTERVRFLQRYIHNREQFAHFDSDVGLYVADTPMGEPQTKIWNSRPELLENERARIDRFCRYNYGALNDFVVER